MKLVLLRFASGPESTLGVLIAVEKSLKRFLCFTLEDQHQTQKVYGETRIPTGTYRLGLRTEGGHHERYRQRFPDMHVGMIEVLDVPGFTHILIHIGNTDDDTAGCILVGDGAFQNVTERGRIASSTAAYERVYDDITCAMDTADAHGEMGIELDIIDYA